MFRLFVVFRFCEVVGKRLGFRPFLVPVVDTLKGPRSTVGHTRLDLDLVSREFGLLPLLPVDCSPSGVLSFDVRTTATRSFRLEYGI